MSRILLIDDEPATRLVTQNRLQDLGYQVAAVENGAMGLHEARETGFDLVVIDAGLGDGASGSGGVGAFEVCKRLKQTPQTTGVPVIMTSKQASGVEEMRRGFEAGCDTFLNKTATGVLDEVVRSLLRFKAQQNDLARQNRALEEASRRLREGLQQGADLEQALQGASDSSLVHRELTAGRPDGVLLVDSDGVVRNYDRGARDLLGANLEGRNLGRLAPASGLEAFVRDARTDTREGFRFDAPAPNGRPRRSLTASVVPLVANPGSRELQMRVVHLLDSGRRRLAAELMHLKEYTIPRREVGVLLEAARTSFSLSTLVGTSPAMQRVRSAVREAARTFQPALITGAPDSGKQHVARTIHFEGESGGAFLPLNCAALSPEHLEGELFGQVKGATPEALADRPGLLQLANHGTLYLESVEALTSELQERLEQSIRTGSIRRAGDRRQERVEVRILAGSGADLRSLVDAGEFSASLYELLSGHEVRVPALHERSEDVVILAQHFLGRLGAGRKHELSSEAMRQLEGHDWPGNVRELAACIERACRSTDGDVIDVEHLPAPLGDAKAALATHEMVPAQPPPSAQVGGTHAQDRSPTYSWEIGVDEPVSLELYEKKALLRALHETRGDKLAAARLLKVGKSTLYRKLKRYGIQ